MPSMRQVALPEGIWAVEVDHNPHGGEIRFETIYVEADSRSEAWERAEREGHHVVEVRQTITVIEKPSSEGGMQDPERPKF